MRKPKRGCPSGLSLTAEYEGPTVDTRSVGTVRCEFASAGDDADASSFRRYHSLLYYVQPACLVRARVPVTRVRARTVRSFHPRRMQS